MVLDTQTLVVAAVVIALVLALMGALVWQTTRTYPGRWVLGNFLAALSLLFLRLRDTVPDWITIVVANALAMASGIAYFQGIRRFRGLRIAWWPECVAGALGVLGVAYFRYATNDITARILVISVVLGYIGIACALTLLKDIPRNRRTAFLSTGIAFLAGGVVHFVRGFYEIAYAPVSSIFERTPVNIIFFLLVAVGGVSWSFGFILLTGERFETVRDPAFASDHKISAAGAKPFLEIIPEVEVQQQLRRILESDVFRRSPQMERFLALTVERSLRGRPEDLKEYALGRDVFHRGENYDPRNDSIVRVEAQRLRRKLREYYESPQGRDDPVIINLPAGRYVPVIRYTQS